MWGSELTEKGGNKVMTETGKTETTEKAGMLELLPGKVAVENLQAVAGEVLTLLFGLVSAWPVMQKDGSFALVAWECWNCESMQVYGTVQCSRNEKWGTLGCARNWEPMPPRVKYDLVALFQRKLEYAVDMVAKSPRLEDNRPEKHGVHTLTTEPAIGVRLPGARVE
jgi:hypothetical protein